MDDGMPALTTGQTNGTPLTTRPHPNHHAITVRLLIDLTTFCLVGGSKVGDGRPRKRGQVQGLGSSFGGLGVGRSFSEGEHYALPLFFLWDDSEELWCYLSNSFCILDSVWVSNSQLSRPLGEERPKSLIVILVNDALASVCNIFIGNPRNHQI